MSCFSEEQMDRRFPVHRAIVVVDVEGFGDPRRTNRHQVEIRDGLYRAMQDAFGRAGIPWDSCDHEDRGDGIFILVPAEVPKSLLVESLPPALVAALRITTASTRASSRSGCEWRCTPERSPMTSME